MSKFVAVAVIAVLSIGLGVFFYLNPPGRLNQSANKNPDQFFSSSTANLTDAKPFETVELKDGDMYDLTADIVRKNINGTEVKMLSYNGSIPGPLIKVAQNAKVTINFKNNTDVETTLHSHGVRMDNAFDGTQDITQEPIPMGGTFSYKLSFPDPGVFWYHPHIREDYAQDLGLYGNYLVTSSDANYFPKVNREQTLILDDILLENGQIAPYSKTAVDRTLMGRFGNTMLVNGETNYQQTINAGEVIRFYLTNTASTRVFDFSIPNARMKLLGSDGGRFTKEQFVDSVIISPSERYIVDVFFPNQGVYQIENKTPQKTYTLGTLNVGNQITTASYKEEFNTLRQNDDVAAIFPNLEQYYTKPADKSLTFTLDMSKLQQPGSQENAMPGMDHGGMSMSDENIMETGDSGEKIEWEETNKEMNTMSNKDTVTWKMVDDASKKENMDIDWQFNKGDLVKLKLFNDPKSSHPMQHPIHVHGQRAIILSINGERNDNPVFKDTILVQKGDTVELLVEMSNPGNWLIHCHIPEHMEAGMMSKLMVN